MGSCELVSSGGTPSYIVRRQPPAIQLASFRLDAMPAVHSSGLDVSICEGEGAGSGREGNNHGWNPSRGDAPGSSHVSRATLPRRSPAARLLPLTLTGEQLRQGSVRAAGSMRVAVRWWAHRDAGLDDLI